MSFEEVEGDFPESPLEYRAALMRRGNALASAYKWSEKKYQEHLDMWEASGVDPEKALPMDYRPAVRATRSPSPIRRCKTPLCRTPPSPRLQYCEKCRGTGTKPRGRQRGCTVCGNALPPRSRRDRKYCSRSCSNKANYGPTPTKNK